MFWIRIRIASDRIGSDPDPLVRDTDPRIRIRTKMSWILNTGLNLTKIDQIKKSRDLHGLHTPTKSFHIRGTGFDINRSRAVPV